jgi:ATPase subunit of ABC transporter with duplicated ATPase domains
VLLAQALFSDPEVLLLDEPTNHLDINTIRWLENILTQRNSTMIIISHDRHFLNSVCTHMADLDYGELRLFPGNYDEYMTVATQSREQLLSDNAKKKARSPNCKRSSAASRPTPRKPNRQLPAPKRSTRSSWPRSSLPAVSARSSVSSRPKSCTARPSLSKTWPKALTARRCSRLQLHR